MTESPRDCLVSLIGEARARELDELLKGLAGRPLPDDDTDEDEPEGRCMPSVSTKQKNAMRAAAAGNSTLGIPESVGKDYVAADKKAGKRKLPAKKKSR